MEDLQTDLSAPLVSGRVFLLIVNTVIFFAVEKNKRTNVIYYNNKTSSTHQPPLPSFSLSFQSNFLHLKLNVA